jgi:uncharacterized protein YxjI
MKNYIKNLRNGLAALGIAGIIAGCGNGMGNPDYTVQEYLWNSVKTVGVGFKYDIFEGNKKGKLLYTIKPDYQGKFKKLLLADAYVLNDADGRTVNTVDGKILTVSSVHNVYDSSGKQEKTISRKFGSDLLDKILRLISNRDSYSVKDMKGKTLMEIQETWSSVLSPFLRKYGILDPDTKKETGKIQNVFKIQSLFGAQTYEIRLNENTPENARNLALVIRVIDGVEDMEESHHSSSSSSHSNN